MEYIALVAVILVVAIIYNRTTNKGNELSNDDMGVKLDEPVDNGTVITDVPTEAMPTAVAKEKPAKKPAKKPAAMKATKSDKAPAAKKPRAKKPASQ